MDFRAYQGLEVSRVVWFGGLVILRLQVSRCGKSIDKIGILGCRTSRHCVVYQHIAQLT